MSLSVVKSSRDLFLTCATVLFLTPLSGLSIDIFTPALPQMQSVFGVSSAKVSSMLVFYLVGFGLSQIFWGWLSDSVGRKRVLNIGLYSALASSWVLCFSDHWWWLLCARFFQGASLGAVNTICRAIFIDLFSIF